MIDFDIRKRFQPKPQNTVGLDIGSHSIKVLEVTPPTAGRHTLASFGLKKIQGLPREAVATSVRNLFDELNISVKDVTLSLSGPPLIARVISMPKMSDDELKSAVRFETEKLIPFDINECIIDFQILSPAVKGKTNAEILLAAVKRDQVMQKVKIAEEAGLSVRAVDVDSFALANAFLAGGAVTDESRTYAILNVGAAFTNLSILKGRAISVVRDIPVGGNDITAAIGKKLGLSPQAAEEIKIAPKEKKDQIADNARSVLAALLDEIKLSFGYHENQSGVGIDEVYVSGGSADVTGLDEAFEEALGAKPRRWEGFQFMNTPNIDTAAMGSMKNAFTIAIGLAIR